VIVLGHTVKATSTTAQLSWFHLRYLGRNCLSDAVEHFAFPLYVVFERLVRKRYHFRTERCDNALYGYFYLDL
jgi:hypothetical protein